MRHLGLAVAGVLSASLATLAALSSIRRGLSKVGGDAWRVSVELFWSNALPAVTAGLLVAVLGLWISAKRPLSGLAVLVAAPIAAFAVDLVLIGGL